MRRLYNGMSLTYIIRNYDEKGDEEINRIHKSLWESFKESQKVVVPVYVPLKDIGEFLKVRNEFIPIDQCYIDKIGKHVRSDEFSKRFVNKLIESGYDAQIYIPFPPIVITKVFAGLVIQEDPLTGKKEIVSYTGPVIVSHFTVLVKLPNGKFSLYDSRKQEVGFDISEFDSESDGVYVGRPIPKDVLRKAIERRKKYCIPYYIIS